MSLCLSGLLQLSGLTFRAGLSLSLFPPRRLFSERARDMYVLKDRVSLFELKREQRWLKFDPCVPGVRPKAKGFFLIPLLSFSYFFLPE